MAKIRVNSGSGKKVLVNNPGRPSTAHVNRPTGSPIPIKTGKDIGVSAYPVYLRNTTNTAEIGTAANKAEVVTILNGDAGWSALGTWSQDSNGIFCTGTPTKIIGYNKVGTLFSRSDVADWSYSDGDITFVNDTGKMHFTTTNNSVAHRITLDAYGQSFLSAIDITYDIDVISFNSIFRVTMGLNGVRPLNAVVSSYNSVNGNAGTTVGSVGRTAGTYNITLRRLDNVVQIILVKGASTETTTYTFPMTTTEFQIGKFYMEFLAVDVKIYNFKVNCICYKNIDNVGIGDSVMWGRGADSFAQTWYNQVVGSKPSVLYAHGNDGFDEWASAIAELTAVAPATIFIMGSYVNTGAGLSSFQTKYTNIVNTIKGFPTTQRIYHCASFPNNFSTDIRPFNNWKAATFTTGVDRYLDDFYALLLEGSSGYDLNNSYDWGGSHLTQAAQDIVAAAMLTEL